MTFTVMCLCVRCLYLHFGVNTAGDLVFQLIGSGVRLGQQEWIGQRAILWFHYLWEKHLGSEWAK